MPVCKQCYDKEPCKHKKPECYYCDRRDVLYIGSVCKSALRDPCELCCKPYTIEDYRNQFMCTLCRKDVEYYKNPNQIRFKSSCKYYTKVVPNPCPPKCDSESDSSESSEEEEDCPQVKCSKQTLERLDTVIGLLSCIKQSSAQTPVLIQKLETEQSTQYDSLTTDINCIKDINTDNYNQISEISGVLTNIEKQIANSKIDCNEVVKCLIDKDIQVKSLKADSIQTNTLET